MGAKFEMMDVEAEELDYLTRILDRKHLEPRIRRSLRKDLSEEKSYSIILFDIDYFKAINDLISHSQGDEVLRDIGRIMHSLDSEVAKYTGLYGRWGGEEFLVALPYATEDDALGLAERIREAVKSYTFTDVVSGQTLERKITVTLGVNTEEIKMSESGISRVLKGLVKKADTALSYGKLLGRDRVAIFSRYLAHEMRNLNKTRTFYFNLVDEDLERLSSAMGRSRNLRGKESLKELIRAHAEIIKQHVEPLNTRTQAEFADKFYREVRKLPCEEKTRVLRFMEYFMQGRYD
jgi:diguanylate cyclase (GGDEF)-like protein